MYEGLLENEYKLDPELNWTSSGTGCITGLETRQEQGSTRAESNVGLQLRAEINQEMDKRQEAKKETGKT